MTFDPALEAPRTRPRPHRGTDPGADPGAHPGPAVPRRTAAVSTSEPVQDVNAMQIVVQFKALDDPITDADAVALAANMLR